MENNDNKTSFIHDLTKNIIFEMIREEMTRRSEEIGSKIDIEEDEESNLYYRSYFTGHRFYRKNQKVLTSGDNLTLYVDDDYETMRVQVCQRKSKKGKNVILYVYILDGMTESVKDQLTSVIDFYFRRVKNFYTEDFDTIASQTINKHVTDS